MHVSFRANYRLNFVHVEPMGCACRSSLLVLRCEQTHDKAEAKFKHIMWLLLPG